MVELIHFGDQAYAYILLVIVLGLGLFLIGVVCRNFYTLFIPSKRILKKRSRILLLFLISWPLLILGGSIWACYRIGYCYFNSLRIVPKQKIVVHYLWPKGEVEILSSDITSVAVIKKGIGWQASDSLVIETKNGRKYFSSSPVPEKEILPDKISEELGLKK